MSRPPSGMGTAAQLGTLPLTVPRNGTHSEPASALSSLWFCSGRLLAQTLMFHRCPCSYRPELASQPEPGELLFSPPPSSAVSEQRQEWVLGMGTPVLSGEVPLGWPSCITTGTKTQRRCWFLFTTPCNSGFRTCPRLATVCSQPGL